MKKNILFSILFSSVASAQTLGESLDKIGEKIDVNVYLRSSYEASDNQNFTNGFKINEARMEVMGSITDDLKFRTRWRMNRQVLPSSVSNAPSSLDYAYITYQFGEEKKYAVTVGKQINNIGSWEFRDNPTYEYQYSEHVSRQLHLFPVGVEFTYKLNPTNSFHFQGFNPSAFTFEELHHNAKYSTNGLEKSKFPLGFNLTWRGSLWNGVFQTNYSVTTSQIAKGKHNFQISLGNKIVLNKLSGYLDLHHTDMKVDYVNIISPMLNAHNAMSDVGYTPVFAQDMQFQSAVMRVNYSLSPQWFLNAKTVLERIYGQGYSNAKMNYINQLALEYKPFERQNFKLFGYYAHFNSSFAHSLQSVAPRRSYGMFSVGALWFLNVL